jgi:hypothetical protein
MPVVSENPHKRQFTCSPGPSGITPLQWTGAVWLFREFRLSAAQFPTLSGSPLILLPQAPKEHGIALMPNRLLLTYRPSLFKQVVDGSPYYFSGILSN